MRITFIIVLLLASFFAFSREMEPGSEYYNLSVQLVRDISSLEFSDCPAWTTAIDQQEFICANYNGDARNFPNSWDASLARVINNFNLEDALDWNIGALGINKMYSINDSIMSVTLESPNNNSLSGASQLVIYVARPLTLDDFATASSPTVSTPSSTTQIVEVPLPQSSANNSTGSNIIIQPVPSTANTVSSASSNPTSNFSDVTTSTVPNNFYGYPTYEAYVEAYRLKVTNPSTTSQPIQQQQTSSYSNSLPAYCITYPSRPECTISSQPQVAQQQSVMPFPSNSVQQQSVQQTTQSFNGYPSYEAYLQAFRQQHAQGTQAAQSQAYAQQTQGGQGFRGFASYEAYLQDYNQRYGQAGQVTGSTVTTPTTSTVTTPAVTTPVVTTPVVTTPVVTTATTSTSSETSISNSTASSGSSSESDSGSSQFQVSASSLGANSNSTSSNSNASTSTSASSSNSSQEASGASSEILSLAADSDSSGGILGKISTRGFRNVPWGSTPVRTKDIETWELVDEGLAKDEAYYLAYDGEILGTKVLAVYYFSPKTKILGRGAYIFMGADEENSVQVTRHTSLHNMLGEDYGSPNRNEKLWLNEDAKGMSDIDALETGDMLYVTQWDDNQIDVELSLFASSDELMNRVLYSSKLFSVVIDEELN